MFNNKDMAFINKVISNCYMDAMTIQRKSHQYFLNNDTVKMQQCDRFNKIINNCIVPGSCQIGEGTYLAYGGLGVLVHKDAKIGKNCVIGTNTTLGHAPTIGDFVYIATGVRIIKSGLHIGNYVIIGANAVVTKDIPDCSIAVGIPAKVVKKIDKDNITSYLRGYFKKFITDDSIMDKMYQEFLEYRYK